MEAVGIMLVLLLLIGGKVWLMRSVWRMAGEQGKSQPLCLAASLFAALITYAALRISGHADQHWINRAAESHAIPEENAQ